MTKLLTQNAKMKKSGGQRYAIFNWGIPAFKSETGERTCPFAGKCAAGCYATQKTYTWPVVAAAYEWRYQQSKQSDFIDKMQAAIDLLKSRKSVADKQLVIRIHDSGDYYSGAYFLKWLQIMAANPDVLFYAYTKAVKMHQRHAKRFGLPANYKWIQSEGGTEDNAIDYDLPHSRVFKSDAELAQAGYEDAMHNDAIAFTSLTGRIGLVYHGADSKQWSTAI